MKPRTHIQQEVAHLSKRLPRLTATQKAYAFRHCFKHYAIKRADGTNICTECGHSWKSDHDLADTLCGCTCPHCGMQLEALRTRKSVFSENEYFSIVTTSKQYQVIRFFFVKFRYKAGQAAEYSIYEVVQRWISPDGKTTTVARLRGMSMLYYDQWSEYSDMEVRKNNRLHAYDIAPMCTYPRQRFIPELKRNGFNGDYHNTLPYDLFTAILSDSQAETLLKAGQYAMLRHYIRSSFDMGRYWASVKICIRNGYTISDGSMWCDTIDLLRHFGKDTNSPKYVCPADLKVEHDKLVAKRNLQRERERTEQQRQNIENGEIIEEGSMIDVFTDPQKPTTKDFVKSINNVELPALLQSSSISAVYTEGSKLIVRLSFIGNSAGDPIVSGMVKKFDVDINIIYGNIDSLKDIPFGTLVIEISGSAAGIKNALQYLHEQQLKVEVIGYVS